MFRIIQKYKNKISRGKKTVYKTDFIRTMGGKYECLVRRRKTRFHIGEKLNMKTDDPKSKSYLIQRISTAVQTGNVASIPSSLPAAEGLATVLASSL